MPKPSLVAQGLPGELDVVPSVCGKLQTMAHNNEMNQNPTLCGCQQERERERERERKRERERERGV